MKDAYGTTIHAELSELVGSRRVTLQQLYTTLCRLEEKGLLRSKIGMPTPVRGGRAKKFYRISPAGMRALALSMESMEKSLQVWVWWNTPPHRGIYWLRTPKSKPPHPVNK